MPPIWDAVRFSVDQAGKPGLYILTGSATPHHKGILHSGTGRIARLRMRPMTLFESGDSCGKGSLAAIIGGTQTDEMTGQPELRDLIYLAVRGGWPATISSPRKNVGQPAREYIKAVVADDVDKVIGQQRDKRKMMRLLQSLARNECTTASNNKLREDMQETDAENIDLQTLATYLDVFERLFILENIKPYSPHLRSAIRLKQLDKRHFVDPSLPCALLGANVDKLFGDLRTFGFIFESMCLRDLTVYAQSIGASVCHYQDYRNNEIDCVVRKPDGAWSAFEIKLGMNQVDEAAANLIKIRDAIAQGGGEPPQALAVVCGMAPAVFRRPDGVYVVPPTALKP